MRQASLFGDETTMDGTLPARAAQIPGSRDPLSPAQRRFNTLLGRIEKLRAEREQWGAFAPTHAQRIANELLPRAARLRERQVELAQLLDRQLAHPGLGPRQRALLRELLLALITELLEEEETEQLVALYDRHAGVSHGEAQRAGFELLRTLAEDLPVDVEAYAGEASPEAFSAWLDRELKPHEPRPRKRSRKSSIPEHADAASAVSGTQALRTLFRRLASTLHPDRESDPLQRERKTVLMQDLNAAYAAGDLLRVLELQQTVDARAAGTLAGLSDAQLRPYIELLEQQVERLGGEIEALKAPFAAALPGRALTPAALQRDLEQAIAQIAALERGVTADLERFADVDQLKAMLKTPRRVEGAERRSRGETRRRRR